MYFVDKLERKIGKYAPSNLTLYLIIGQVLLYVFIYSQPQYASFFPLKGTLVLQGEWWRILTFLFMPNISNPIFFAIASYLYYLYGSALERQWGSFRYFIYLFIAYIATALCAFIFPQDTIFNLYIFTSLFLAFAYLYPNFTLLLFFIIPVKIKWLALITWIFGLLIFLSGPTSQKVQSLIVAGTFFLFFGKDLLQSGSLFFWRTTRKSAKVLQSTASVQSCNVCGANKEEKEILYICTACQPEQYYCEVHIRDHSHADAHN